MDTTGLIRKYVVNRKLTDQELKEQLHQKQRLDVEPAYQLSVIRMNSTFMEVVDKYFAWKGLVTMVCWVGIFMLGGFFITLLVSSVASGKIAKEWWFLLAVLAICSPVIGFSWWGISKESFAYTHYPIRLNRKTRMVHVFRTDGAVLSVPWDEVFFCLGKPGAGIWANGVWEVQGHVLDKDGVTVRETFAFSEQGVGEGDRKALKHFWEFNRRYMEDGPESTAEYVKVCLPIKERRESFWFGFHRVHSMVGFAPLVFQVYELIWYAITYPGRWFGMRTSKIPVWPKEIEDQCAIEPNDPYIREASMNPERV